MNTTEKTSLLRRYGPGLLDKGYPIVPILPGTKHPHSRDWQLWRADRKQLDGWLQGRYARGGVGINTKHIPAVDLDIRDSEVLQLMVDWCNQHLGKTVQRVGEAPKTLMVYRTDTPFPKLNSRKYRDPSGREHKVEILGNGQQFVAYAIHKDTGQPYIWVTEKSLIDINPADLPCITAEQAQAAVDYFESIVPGGWVEIASRAQAQPEDPTLSKADRFLLYAKPRLSITAERLKTAVSMLDPDMSRADWIRVGMGLYHQFEGAEEGFELWDEWSAQSPKYNEKEMRRCWASLLTDLRKEPVTAATIIHLAKAAKGKEQEGWLDAFLSRYLYVEEGDRVCDLKKPPHCCISKLNEFKNRTANVRHEVPAPTAREPEKTRLDPVWKAWLVHPDRKSAEGTTYVPEENRVVTDAHGLYWVNEFHMPVFTKSSRTDKLGVFFEHMDYLLPKKIERDWFIDWIAFNLQRPGIRCKVTPLHVSVAHGVGRGWVVELMGKLLGQWNCSKTKMNVLAGEGAGSGFHDYMHHSLFCAIEEIREGSKRFALSDLIRDLLTESPLELNLKYGSKGTQPVYTNFFLMTNHPDAMVLTKQDRRVNVFSGPKAPKENAYYTRLYNWLKTDGVAQLHHWLMQRDLSGFGWQRSMNTLARTRMIENNRTETETLFWELMEEPPYPAMTFQQVVRAMRALSDRDPFEVVIESGQLVKLLQHHAEQVIVKVNGRKERPWILSKENQIDKQDIREIIKKCGI